MIWNSVRGLVSSNSIVPYVFSSANARIVIAGIRNKYIHGAKEKRGSREAKPEDNIFMYSLGEYVHKNKELIKRKSTKTMGPIKELKKYINLDFQRIFLKSHSKILYVTETIGHGTNLVTGDYSVGANGFLIENGEFKYPVNEITIAGNLNEMFKNIILANDLEFKYSINSPTMMIDGMTVAGKWADTV